jgi:hypothetical protein
VFCASAVVGKLAHAMASMAIFFTVAPCDDNKLWCYSDSFASALLRRFSRLTGYFFWQPFMHMSYSVLQVFPE